jgi:predicted transcriptional regulator
MSLWKRGFLEIMAEILENLKDSPMKKTHITFKCNLDSRAVTKYLTTMQVMGLVERASNSLYAVTQKGIAYSEHYNAFVSLVEYDLKNFVMEKGETPLLANMPFAKRD